VLLVITTIESSFSIQFHVFASPPLAAIYIDP